MLGYRHAFHAGNHADVLKHVVLARTLAYLLEKDRPLLYLDSHAGAGLYDLKGDLARRTCEAAEGVARLWAAPGAPALLGPYLEVLRAHNRGRDLRRYPGSPVIARDLLRPGDRAVCCELHTTDYPLLAAALGGDPRFRIAREDGLAALRAHLPPRERRALVMIDPSYELDADYRAVPAALSEALRRFPVGVYLVWYPLLAGAPAERLIRGVAALRPAKALRLELAVTAPHRGLGRTGGTTGGMSGSGLLLINPPWVLEAELRAALPWLVDLLGDGTGGWRLEGLGG